MPESLPDRAERGRGWRQPDRARLFSPMSDAESSAVVAFVHQAGRLGELWIGAANSGTQSLHGLNLTNGPGEWLVKTSYSPAAMSVCDSACILHSQLSVA